MAERKSGPYIGVAEFFGTQDERFKDLSILGKRLRYKQDIILILKGDEEKLKQDFPETYKTILTCRHNFDKRTPFEYAQDIAASWLFEDFITAKAEEVADQTNEPFKLILAGADCNRQFLPTTKVSSASDCKFTYHGIDIPVEIVTDYGLYWKNKQMIDLRDDKFEKLTKEKTMLVGISTKDIQYLTINFANNPTAEKHYHYLWKKDAYTIHFEDNGIKMKKFTMIRVLDELMETVRKINKDKGT